MASEGPLICGLGEQDDSYGTLGWASPEAIEVDDANYAEGTAFSGGDTWYLKATEFGFAIPDGATIVGIEATMKVGSSTGGDTCNESVIKIVKSDGTVGSENKSTSAALPADPATAVWDYGGATDLWSESWSASDINDVDFGVVASYSSSLGFPWVFYMKMTVYYTEGGSSDIKSANDLVIVDIKSFNDLPTAELKSKNDLE